MEALVIFSISHWLTPHQQDDVCFLSLSTWPPFTSIVVAYGGTPVSRASVNIVVTCKWMKLFLSSGKWQYKKSKRELDHTEGREWKVGISQPGADWESICSLLSVLSQKLIWRVPASSHRTCDTEDALVLQHLSPRHPHTPDSVVWLQPRACRSELSDLCKLLKCNRSFLMFSSITVHTNGVHTVQRDTLSRCLGRIPRSRGRAFCWHGFTNDRGDGFERLS